MQSPALDPPAPHRHARRPRSRLLRGGLARRLVPTALGWIGLALAKLPALAGAACPTPGEIVRVAAVVDDLDLALEDGRTLRLAGLDPARPTPSDPTLGARIRQGLEARVVGHDVAVAILGPPDRWERLAALVAVPDSKVPAAGPALPGGSSLNADLVAEGVARMRPESGTPGCLGDLVRQEESARAAGLGLWADPYYAVVDADDRRGLAARTGAMALVVGRARLRRTRGRISLDLGQGRYGFSATIAPNALKRLARAGVNPQDLVGSRLRVRGFLDDRFGPRIEVTEAAQIERLDASAPAVSEAGAGPGRAETPGEAR